MSSLDRAFNDWYTMGDGWWCDECETNHEDDCPNAWVDLSTVALIANECLVSDDSVDMDIWQRIHGAIETEPSTNA